MSLTLSISTILPTLSSTRSSSFVSSPALATEARALLSSGALPAALLPSTTPASASAPTPGAVRHVYVTSVGDGPRVLTSVPGAALADGVTGLPFVLAGAGGDAGEFAKAL